MNYINGILLLFLNIWFIAKPYVCWEFCKPKIQLELCGRNDNHTVCLPSNAFYKEHENLLSEKFIDHVPVTRKFKRILLDMNNEYRNRVASGNEVSNTSDGVKKYPIASRMRELIWDNELMYVSHIHTKQVNLASDKCRHTQRYRTCGQIVTWKGDKSRLHALEVVRRGLEQMFNQKDLIPDPSSSVAKNNLQGVAGDFTTIINDRASRIGCSVALGANCVNKRINPIGTYNWCYYLGCNYDAENYVGDYIYKTSYQAGSRCSDWKTGMSKQYENLCHNTGEYFNPTKEVGQN